MEALELFITFLNGRFVIAALNACSVIAAIVAARYWYLSSKVEIPVLLDIPMGVLQEPFWKAAKLSSIAAAAAAFSASFQAFVLVIGIVQ